MLSADTEQYTTARYPVPITVDLRQHLKH